MSEFRVVCINDKAKPKEVPAASWIEKDEVYTVVEVSRMAKQRMTLGYKLAEVSFPADCPYQHYIATRFRPYSEEDALAEKAVEALLEEEFQLLEAPAP